MGQAINQLEQFDKEQAYDRSKGIHSPIGQMPKPQLKLKKSVGKKQKPKPKPKIKKPKMKQSKISSFFQKN